MSLISFGKSFISDDGRKMNSKQWKKYMEDKEKRVQDSLKEMQRAAREQNEREEEEKRKIQMSISRVQEEKEEEAEARRSKALKDLEVSNERFEVKEDAMTMTDRIEAHRAGTLFKNAVISNEAPSDRDLNMTRLRTFKQSNDFTHIHLDDIIPIHLNRSHTELPLIEAINDKRMSRAKEFCLVSDVFIHYIPLDSFYGEHNPVEVKLNDFRKVRKSTARWFKMSNAVGYNILFTMDYCLATRDLGSLILSFSTSLNSFKDGVTWGVAKVIVSLTFMDFPVKLNIQETLGVMHLSDSDLKEFLSDPLGLDAVMTPETLKRLQKMHGRGEIEDINAPKDDTMKLNRATTGKDGSDESSGQGEVDARDMLTALRNKHAKDQEIARKKAAETRMQSGETIQLSKNPKRPNPILKGQRKADEAIQEAQEAEEADLQDRLNNLDPDEAEAVRKGMNSPAASIIHSIPETPPPVQTQMRAVRDMQ